MDQTKNASMGSKSECKKLMKERKRLLYTTDTTSEAKIIEGWVVIQEKYRHIFLFIFLPGIHRLPLAEIRHWAR